MNANDELCPLRRRPSSPVPVCSFVRVCENLSMRGSTVKEKTCGESGNLVSPSWFISFGGIILGPDGGKCVFDMFSSNCENVCVSRSL